MENSQNYFIRQCELTRLVQKWHLLVMADFIGIFQADFRKLSSHSEMYYPPGQLIKSIAISVLLLFELKNPNLWPTEFLPFK